MLCDNSKKAQLSLRIKKLDIRAVRGPLTRKALINAGQKCPEKYGDPAILMPLIYEPAKVIKRYDVSLILHHTHSLSTLTNHDIHQINVLTTNYKEFIDEILSSKLIISSSLHGIILAETYGVPAILLVNDTGNLFKYKDWYFSTERDNIVSAQTISEALELTPLPLPHLENMQKAIISAFPIDLWNEEDSK